MRKNTIYIYMMMITLLGSACANAAAKSVATADWPMGKVALHADGTFTITMPARAAGKTIALDATRLTVGGKPVTIAGSIVAKRNSFEYNLSSESGGVMKVNFSAAGKGIFLLDIRTSPAETVPWDIRFRAEPNEHFYGFGERFNTFDMRGYETNIINYDAFAGVKDRSKRGDRAYKTVPFFSSSRGYGLWLDDPIVSMFDMDSGKNGAYSIRFEDDFLRIYIFAGPRPADVIERYTALSGRPPLWPAWVFGPWKSRDVHKSRADVEEDIVRQRDLDIPGSLIVIDSPWETCYHDFKLNKKQFQNPEDMLRMAHDYGYKVIAWIAPFMNIYNAQDMVGIRLQKCPAYDPLKKINGFIQDEKGEPFVMDWWKGTGSPIDFTNPEAVSFWKKKIKEIVAQGFDGIKADDGEGGTYMDAANLHYFDPDMPRLRMVNYESYLYNKATYEALAEATGGDTVVWARSGTAGTQKFSIQWPGDNPADFTYDGFPSVVVSGLAAAMSGFSIWGHDIGGYLGSPDAEVFTRWAEFGALSPVMQIHTTANKGAWDFGPDAEKTYRKFAKLHTSLFPYIYTYAKIASEKGLPIIRPLPFADPDDPQAHVQRYEYLFGDELLVAPVVEKGAVSREVYFPRGSRWIDFRTGAEHSGGKIEKVDAPLDALPLFVRAGALIPMLPDDVDTLVAKEQIKKPDIVAMDDRLVLRCWPAPKPSSFNAFDGSSFSLEKKNRSVSLKIKTKARPITAVVFADPPKSVSIGKLVLKKATCDALYTGNWCYDKAEKSILLRTDVEDGVSSILIKY